MKEQNLDEDGKNALMVIENYFGKINKKEPSEVRITIFKGCCAGFCAFCCAYCCEYFCSSYNNYSEVKDGEVKVVNRYILNNLVNNQTSPKTKSESKNNVKNDYNDI